MSMEKMDWIKVVFITMIVQVGRAIVMREDMDIEELEEIFPSFEELQH